MYTIIEMQTNGGQTICNPPLYAKSRAEAMSMYHGILQYAALSSVESHACVVLDHTGRTVTKECYTHAAESEAADGQTS